MNLVFCPVSIRVLQSLPPAVLSFRSLLPFLLNHNPFLPRSKREVPGICSFDVKIVHMTHIHMQSDRAWDLTPWVHLLTPCLSSSFLSLMLGLLIWQWKQGGNPVWGWTSCCWFCGESPQTWWLRTTQACYPTAPTVNSSNLGTGHKGYVLETLVVFIQLLGANILLGSLLAIS